MRQRDPPSVPFKERRHCAGIVQMMMQHERAQRCLEGWRVLHQPYDIAERSGRLEVLSEEYSKVRQTCSARAFGQQAPDSLVPDSVLGMREGTGRNFRAAENPRRVAT
jgi:hypothetical protein